MYVDRDARKLTTPANGLDDLTRVADLLREHNIEVEDLGLSRPSLDDVFLSLTGHAADDSTEDI